MIFQMSIEALHDQAPDLYRITRSFLLQNGDILGSSALITSLEKTQTGEFQTPVYPSAKSDTPRPEVFSLHLTKGENARDSRWFLSSNASSMQTEICFEGTLPRCVAYNMGGQNQLINFRELEQDESQETLELVAFLLAHPQTKATIEAHRTKLPALQRELSRVALKIKPNTPSYQKLLIHRADLKRSTNLPSSSVSSQAHVVAKASRVSYADTAEDLS